MIICRRVNKEFRLNRRPIRVLDDVSLQVAAGESVALIGPSGCGKSTLLGLIAGFFPADGGEGKVEGRVSLMMQQDMLLPHRSVLDNACLPVEVRDKKRLPAARAEAASLLPLFGLDGFGESYPDQLSGGMRQRAALLRTVMDGGDFWLLDEPFGKLDALTKEELQEWLFGIKSRFKPGVLLVTHDINEALVLADRIYVMSERPGRIKAELMVERGQREQQQAEIRRLLLRGK